MEGDGQMAAAVGYLALSNQFGISSLAADHMAMSVEKKHHFSHDLH